MFNYALGEEITGDSAECPHYHEDLEKSERVEAFS
jgi:hypothetical protein